MAEVGAWNPLMSVGAMELHSFVICLKKEALSKFSKWQVFQMAGDRIV